MNTYTSNATPQQIADRLLAAKKILITTHSKPDGDAIGSTLALARALRQKSRSADIQLMGPVATNLLMLVEDTPYELVDEQAALGDQYDLAVVLDTGAWSQLEPLRTWLEPRREMTIGIDHHAHGDDVAAMRIVNPRCASATQVLMPVLEAMDVEIDGKSGGVGEAIFVGLATDTGWFKFSNADASVFRLVARLLDAGVNKNRIFQIIEENDRPQRMALSARALQSLQYVQDGSVALMMLRNEDFKETGGTPEDITGLVNTPMSIGRVRVSVLLSQPEPGETKVSFRSKPAVEGSENNREVDVNKVANPLGGGGHANAAGARLQMNIDEAKTKVIEALQ